MIELNLITNEKIFKKKGNFYCDNIEIKFLIEELGKYFNASLFCRNSIQKRFHKIKFKKIIIFSRDELKQSEMREELRDTRLRFFLGDIRDSERLKLAFDNVDIVIHAAWHVNSKDYLFSPKNIECLNGSKKFAKACKLNKVKKFIGIGTCFEYDLSYGYLSTETPLKPLSIYAISKVRLFKYLKN